MTRGLVVVALGDERVIWLHDLASTPVHPWYAVYLIYLYNTTLKFQTRPPTPVRPRPRTSET
jgi:hypothetical protein